MKEHLSNASSSGSTSRYSSDRILKEYNVQVLTPHFDIAKPTIPSKLVITGTCILLVEHKDPSRENTIYLGKPREFKIVDVAKALNPSDPATQMERTKRIIQLNSYKEIRIFEMDSERIKNQFCSWWDRALPFLSPSGSSSSLIPPSPRDVKLPKQSLVEKEENDMPELMDPILRLVDRIRIFYMKRLDTQSHFREIKDTFQSESKRVLEQISTLTSLDQKVEKTLVRLKELENTHSLQKTRYLSLISSQSAHDLQLQKRQLALEARSSALEQSTLRFEKLSERILEKQRKEAEFHDSITSPWLLFGVMGVLFAGVMVLFFPRR